jgi:hypothetical protein
MYDSKSRATMWPIKEAREVGLLDGNFLHYCCRHGLLTFKHETVLFKTATPSEQARVLSRARSSF